MDMSNISDILEIATSVIGVAAVFASVLPTPYGGILLALKKAIDMAAFNIGKAKNAR